MRGDVITETMLIIKRVKLVDKHEFVKAALNENSQIFIIYVTLLEKYRVYPSKANLIAVLK